MLGWGRGGRSGFLICRGSLERQNDHDDSNSRSEFREEVQMAIYIWKQLFIPLPYCTVGKLNSPASTRLFKLWFVAVLFAFLSPGLSQVNVWPQLQYAAFSEESIISYRTHKEREAWDFSLSFGENTSNSDISQEQQQQQKKSSSPWFHRGALRLLQLLSSTAVSHVQTGHQLVRVDKGFVTADLCSQVHATFEKWNVTYRPPWFPLQSHRNN